MPPFTTITSRTSSGWINLHHRLRVVVDGGDEENPPTHRSSAVEDQAESPICAKRGQKYDIPSGFAAFLAGTHEIDVHIGRYGIPKIFCMPSGNMWLSIVRPGVFRYFKHSHALVETTHVPGKYQVRAKVSEQVRAGIMETVAAEYWFRRKGKKHPAYPDPGPVPEVRDGVKPVDLAVSGRVFSFFRRSHLILHVGKHPILFLERPDVGLTNKWIEWEARLLFDSYPMDSEPLGSGKRVPVEGVDYKLLMSHEDRNTLRWFRWAGANDEGRGTAKVDMDAILGIGASAEFAQGQAGPTGQELALTLLAFHPLMCAAISYRKWAIYLFPLKLLLLVWFCRKVVANIIFLGCLVSGGSVDTCETSKRNV